MTPRTPLATAARGYRAAAPAERAGFEMLTAFAATVSLARAVNYGRERRRRAPLLRSWARRAYHAPRRGSPRVHHFLPGLGLALAAGGAAILTRQGDRALWLSAPFGAGAGLTLDELALLLETDNPYWGSQAWALTQATGAALAAGALGIRFHRRGGALQGRP